VNAPKLRLITQTPDQRIEALLTELGALVHDTTLPEPRRRRLWRAYCEIHACRSVETVRKMEQDMGIGPDAA
jgi:hypothetical protein